MRATKPLFCRKCGKRLHEESRVDRAYDPDTGNRMPPRLVLRCRTGPYTEPGHDWWEQVITVKGWRSLPVTTMMAPTTQEEERP